MERNAGNGHYVHRVVRRKVVLNRTRRSRLRVKKSMVETIRLFGTLQALLLTPTMCSFPHASI